MRPQKKKQLYYREKKKIDKAAALNVASHVGVRQHGGKKMLTVEHVMNALDIAMQEPVVALLQL